MKITPIDIQQMVFQVKFRGFDRDEVNRFLEELALTVENLNRDNSVLRDKLTITEQLVQAGRLLDIPVHDHVIIGRGRYTSFAEAGLL